MSGKDKETDVSSLGGEAWATPPLRATTAWELVARRAQLTPAAPMMLDVDGRRLSFGEFALKAERVAAGLAALGIGAGTGVTWQFPTRMEALILCVALARLGVVQNPIIHAYREREVGAVLRQNHSDWFIVPAFAVGRDYAALARAVVTDLAVPPRLLVVADALPEADPASLPPPPASGDAVRWVYYTSGTSAEPKGVCHTDQTLMAGGLAVATAYGASAADVGSISFPFAHIAGPDYLFMMLAMGMSAVLTENFVPAEAAEFYRRHGVTLAGAGPVFYSGLLNEQRRQPEQPLIPTLRAMTGGGAPKPPALYFQVKAEMGCPIFHGYGMTEAPLICSNTFEDGDEQRAYSDGRPAAGMEIRIVGADGKDVPVGGEGEIRVRGRLLFKGYTDPRLTAAAFDEQGYFGTGDLGVLRSDGCISVTGRLKDMIIRKGENISVAEVEDLLFAHPKVAAAAVIGLPDAERGERVCAVVELREGASPLSFEEMVAHFKAAGIMRQKIPEQLEIVDKLPRNETLQKVLKFKLREQFAGSMPAVGQSAA